MPITANPTEDLRKQASVIETNANVDEEGLLARENALAKEREQQMGALKERRGAAVTDYSAAAKDLQGTMQQEPEKVAMPNPELGPPIDPGTFKDFMYGMMTLALIGAVGGRSHYMGAMEALNGSLKGFREGNMELAKEQKEKYEREYRQAQAKQGEADKRYQKILDNKKLTLNMRAEQLRIASVEFEDWDMNAKAIQHDFDGAHRRIDQNRRRADQMQTLATKLDEQKMFKEMAASSKAANQSEKGWKMYQADGASFRVNENAGLVQKKVGDHWEDSDSLPQNATHIGSNIGVKDTVRDKLVHGAANNALDRMAEADKKFGSIDKLHASPFFGQHPDGVKGQVLHGMGRMALSTEQKNKDSLISGIVDEAIPVFTGGLRSSDSFRQFLISQVPRSIGDNDETTREKWRIFRENISGQSNAFRNKFMTTPEFHGEPVKPGTSMPSSSGAPSSSPGTVMTLDQYLQSQGH